MSKRKYKRGKKVRSIAEFAECRASWFIVYFGSTHPKTTHRGFLESWQYRTLKLFIDRGAVFVADKVEDEKADYKQITMMEMVEDD